MNPMPTLIKRELQEHRTAFLWLPLGTLAFLIFITLAVLSAGDMNFSLHSTITTANETSSYSLESDSSTTSLLNTGLSALETLSDGKKHTFFAFVHLASSYLFYLLFISIAVFYLAGTLHDERSDGSILFWKSMPVSDWQSVLSKLLCIMILVPIIFISAIALYQVALFTIVSLAGLFSGAPVASLWLDSGLVGGWIQLLVGNFIQGLWMLPLYGWLLLVSSCAPRSPVLVATLMPFVPIALEAALFQSRYLLDWIISHLQTVALPSLSVIGSNLPAKGFNIQNSLAVVSQGDFFVGLMVGAIFTAGAIWFRRYKNTV